ncbi:MAG TPA: HAD family phosphatase, partial [Deltaproteobacteria bacterium]|nr:HAD family phosphatase [Deltaproteobacteria bacterium]
MIEAVLFDFGGVLADEGFRIGLHAIAGANGLDPERFFLLARELVYSTGYLTGRVDEHAYWNALRSDAGISGNDADLREIILEGFSLRTWMLDIVRQLKDGGIRLFILSDQTNWLDELEERNHFFYLFEKVFNSFHTGKS